MCQMSGEENIGDIQTIHLLFQAKSQDQFIRISGCVD